MFKVLEYLQKTKTLKNDFFSWSELCYWAEVKAKYVFLTKIMLLNEIQAFFVSLCFFALMFFKSNSTTFRFSLSLTWRHTHYQTIKFLRLYLQNSKRKKQINEISEAATHFNKIGLWHFNPKINASKVPVNQLIFREELV